MLNIIETRTETRQMLSRSTKKQTTHWAELHMWRMKEQQGETEPGRTEEALQRYAKRASIIQQLWIMGQHAEAVLRIRGSEGKTCCIGSCGRSSQSSSTVEGQRLGRVHMFELVSKTLNAGSVWSASSHVNRQNGNRKTADVSTLVNNVYK